MLHRNVDIKRSESIYLKERKTGEIIKSPRKFGIEFEMVPNPEKKQTEDSLIQLHESSEDILPSCWGSGQDGSLSSRRWGVEIQTAPMMLKKGEDDVFQFTKDAVGIGWGVDDSCGTHVHIDANDMKDKPSLIRRVFMAYFVLDYSILAMLPSSRRKNKYCAPLDKTRAKGLVAHDSFYEKGFEFNKIITSQSSRIDFLKMLYKATDKELPLELSEHYNEARYHGINFHSLYSSGSYGTIEIRYLEGTLDATTILMWTAFHQFIIDNARHIREVEAIELFHVKGPKTRLRKFATLTNMPQYLVDWACERIDKFKE